jgi:hypothetical protein
MVLLADQHTFALTQPEARGDAPVDQDLADHHHNLYYGHVSQGTPEWHAVRATAVSASSVGMVAGLTYGPAAGVLIRAGVMTEVGTTHCSPLRGCKGCHHSAPHPTNCAASPCEPHACLQWERDDGGSKRHATCLKLSAPVQPHDGQEEAPALNGPGSFFCTWGNKWV